MKTRKDVAVQLNKHRDSVSKIMERCHGFKLVVSSSALPSLHTTFLSTSDTNQEYLERWNDGQDTTNSWWEWRR
jgi:hypothetical protein